MATKPLRPCKYPGCCVLVPGGYCQDHRPKDRDRRGEDAKTWRWMYGTETWRQLRAAQLLREPWCRECEARGIRQRATDVDHIRPHRGDWETFTDPRNLQSLCHSCHSRKTVEEMRQKSHGFSPGRRR